jgi:hypothetical protein
MSKNFFRPVRPHEVDTKIFREKLEADIARFLERGGVIEVLDSSARSEPMIQSQRNLNRAQVRAAMARRSRITSRDEEE